MIGGVHEAWCFIVVSSLWLTTSMSYKSIPQELSTVSHKSLQQELRVSYTSAVPHRSFAQDCPTRVSNNAWPFVFGCVLAFGFVAAPFFVYPNDLSLQKRQCWYLPTYDCCYPQVTQKLLHFESVPVILMSQIDLIECADERVSLFDILASIYIRFGRPH